MDAVWPLVGRRFCFWFSFCCLGCLLFWLFGLGQSARIAFLRSSLILIILRSGGRAGGGPAAAHFSCLAKKSKQKKATP
ncbi:hypothetical protein, partial [Herbaspirillum sp.]|uniref:hypothetical protein n=1 Tax=Herbaspirillum sp. TaxID=1890675 RepID=UPI00257EEFE8